MLQPRDRIGFVVIAIAGWMNQHKLQVIDYLREDRASNRADDASVYAINLAAPADWSQARLPKGHEAVNRRQRPRRCLSPRRSQRSPQYKGPCQDQKGGTHSP